MSKEKFVSNQEATERLFINIDGKNYFIFKNNNTNSERIKINPDLVEIQSNKIDKIQI